MSKQKQDIKESRHNHAVPDVVVAEDHAEKKSRHILAKLLCLLAATGVWMYAMNLETTDYERVFSKVAVIVDGAAELNTNSDMSVISGYDNAVDIVVSGKKSEVQALQTEEIRAFIDVSELSEAGKSTVPVQVQLPDGFTVVNAEQLMADIYVDVNGTREIPIEITNMDYIISSSYTMGEPSLSHETILVTGPQQVLDLIECASLEFDLGNVTSSKTMVGTPRLMDADGVLISNPYVRCEVTDITVNIPVETTKELRLVVEYVAPEMRSGWQTEVTPTTITVRGDPMMLAAMGDISVYKITSAAVEGEYVVSAGVIDLPENVTMEGELNAITVRLRRVVG